MFGLTANRVVLILHGVFVIATATALFVAAISNSLPHSLQANVAVGVGVLSAIAGGTVTVTKFLDGSQKYDALTVSSASATEPAGPEVFLDDSDGTPANQIVAAGAPDTAPPSLAAPALAPVAPAGGTVTPITGV